MTTSQHIAKHFKELHFGNNWAGVDTHAILSDITWQQATAKVASLNTIAALVYHIDYYVGIVVKVLQGEPLQGSDKYSFDVPPVNSAEDWQQLLGRFNAGAKLFIRLVEQFPESRLWDSFAEGKYGDYGNYYRNLHGVIEHSYYHMGQIALIKKMVSA